jgi:hypothetical protein
MTIMAFTASILTSGMAVKHRTRSYAASLEAANAAESGVHLLAARLSGPGRAELLAAGRHEGVLRGSGVGAPRFEAGLRSGGDDLADNDLDGFVDEEDEADVIEVVSTGSCDRVSLTAYVTLLARYREPALASAVYVDDPTATIDLDGAAFLISGYDIDLARAPTGLVVPAIGVNGEPGLLRAGITAIEGRQVVGEGGAPSVLQVPPLDLEALIDEGARAANVVLAAGEVNQPDEPGAWGTVAHPAVVYSSGPVKISGGASGAGVLLVNGDLEISGGFEWQGVVIVLGGVQFKGGGSGRRILGGLVVQEGVASSGEAHIDGDLHLAGTVDILYSREAIRTVARLLSGYTILNWREGPAPTEARP